MTHMHSTISVFEGTYRKLSAMGLDEVDQTTERSVSMRLLRAAICLLAFCWLSTMAAAPAASAEHTPRNLRGCVLWLRADTSLLTDDRGHVAKWLDQSGHGHDLDRFIGRHPVVGSGINGRPVVCFDGQGYAYTPFDFGHALSAHSVVLLARWTDTAPSNCQRVLSSHTGNWGFGYCDGDDQAWIGNEWIYQKDWNLYGTGTRNTDWHLHTGTMGGSTQPTVEFWKDGTKLMDRPRTLGGNSNGPRQIALGGPQKSKCEIAEVILYNRVLSATELTELWRYFSERYRITSPAVMVAGSPPEVPAGSGIYPIAPGPFKPGWRSMRQYACPDWFRDAKFGIWAHWGPQCQPEQGDWYAYHMYEQSSPQYQYHLAHYGHPSKFGYKDICNAWKADKWDPEKMIELYQRAGAKYFVALANHHCNFDCWDSTYQLWNSVRVGPKKDIVGTWARVARRHGLRFGVTVHSARAWSWFEAAHKADTQGPMMGIVYDGGLTKADGKGQWWDGLDPEELYGPHGANRTPEAFQAYVRKWFNRTKDLVDKYEPDLLYFDDTVPPLGEAGMSVVAHFLNADVQRHAGRIEAVYNSKIYDFHPPKEVYKYLVNDFEGGRADSIQPYPWQTDTCIGNWHYLRGITYRSAESVIKELADIVSKNGNLLLNIPVKGDGSLDAEELKFLDEMARWMAINGECIFGTRPWSICGEGPSNNARDAARQPEGSDRSPQIRFTTKGGTLYAIMLDWPVDGRLLIRSLAADAGQVTGLEVLGHQGVLAWRQTDRGLEVTLPAKKPVEYCIAFKLAGSNLRPSVATRSPRP
jgi:alpha-L-fucosidase